MHNWGSHSTSQRMLNVFSLLAYSNYWFGDFTKKRGKPPIFLETLGWLMMITNELAQVDSRVMKLKYWIMCVEVELEFGNVWKLCLELRMNLL